MSILLSCWYATELGLKVLYVDADPKSQTAFEWHEKAQKTPHPLPFSIEVWPHAHVGNLVDKKSHEYDIVIIDTGGEGNEIAKSAMSVATTLIVAMTPNKADLWRLDATLKACVNAAREVDRADLVDAQVVLTKVTAARNSRTTKNGTTIEGHNDMVRSQIAKQNWPILDHHVSYRSAGYVDVAGHNPFDPDIKVDMSEIKAIADEIELLSDNEIALLSENQ